MRIVELRAANVKRLRAVAIKPDGSVIQITGSNGAGKTSVLDSIFYALAGTKGHASEPIRRGESSASVELDLGEIVVTRRWTEAGTYLEVARKDGSVFKKAQTTLDAIIGELTFDPLAFTRMAPKAQLEQLRSLVKLDIDLDKVDRGIEEAYTHRTDINRRAKSLLERVESLAKTVDASDVAPIDTAKLFDQMQQAAEHNAAAEREKQDRSAKDSRASACIDRAAQLKAEASRLVAEANELTGKADALRYELDHLPPVADPIDVTAVRQELQKAEAENQRRVMQARARAEHETAAGQYTAAQDQAEELTEKITGLQRTKEDAIAKAQMPIEGLSFGAGVVTYNGLPFDQASTAEQIRVATAIGMAMNPKLRILLIKDGSLLDERSLEALTEMADANDFQIWLERVDTSGENGIVIEDGAVVGAPYLSLVGAGT
jgi:DNA repair exonuclease SbcCD ATPase subunit